VLQLAEVGRVDLHRDINHYLDFPIEAFPGSRPVTVTDLLTHTAGVDDYMIGAEAPIGSPISLGAYFRRRIPVLVRKAGAEINYSNHGVALAAYIVERVSGMTFYDYVEERILHPLAMSQSSFRQPLPGPLRTKIAFERFEKPYTIPYPVATLVTTPSDMAKFMLGHLNAELSPVLSEGALAKMHTRQQSPAPEMSGVAYGFFEAEDAGGRALFHAGARDHFSLLYIVPERKFGIFIVMCGAPEQSQLPSRVVREFLRHSFASDGPRVPAAVIKSEIPEWVPGRYRLDATSQRTLEKLVGLGAEMRVWPAANSIAVSLPSLSRGESTERFTHVGPLRYRSESGALIQFRKDPSSGEVKAFRSDFVADPMSLTRIAWHESSFFFVPALMLSYTSFGTFLLISVYWGVRRRTIPARRWLWRLGTILCVLVLLAPLTGLLMALTATEHQLYTIERILTVVMWILNPAILLAACVVALTPFAVFGRAWARGPRIAFGGLGLAAALFLRFVHYWHVWGFQF
jgi:CubicO group peptidase (beta-lactamase class C family)